MASVWSLKCPDHGKVDVDPFCPECEELDWDDKQLPEDKEIDDCHPSRTGKHELYAEAMRLVGARHSKGGLVELVNWLLHRTDRMSRLLDAVRPLFNAKHDKSGDHYSGNCTCGDCEMYREFLSLRGDDGR